MPWHNEVLARRQQRVLTQIGPLLSRLGFYLAGGTAVALHLGHRRSVDFDWFTFDGLSNPLQFAAEIRDEGIAFTTDHVAPGTLHGSVQGVRVSMIRFRYPMLSALRKMRSGIHIAGKADLAAMKLSDVTQRGAKKDFVDIYALGKKTRSLQKMLNWYREKFAVENVAHLMYSLAYFEDAERERLPRMLWDINWQAVKTELQQWLKNEAR